MKDDGAVRKYPHAKVEPSPAFKFASSQRAADSQEQVILASIPAAEID